MLSVIYHRCPDSLQLIRAAFFMSESSAMRALMGRCEFGAENGAQVRKQEMCRDITCMIKIQRNAFSQSERIFLFSQHEGNDAHRSEYID